VSANLDLVRSIYADWERGDFGRTDWADPEIEFLFADGPDPGRWRGLPGMAEGWGNALKAWQHARAEAEEYRELDLRRVLVLDHRSAAGKTSGLKLEEAWTKGATLWHVCNGRVTRLAIYWHRDRAFADLGLGLEGDS
jgi:ketosteroid isomerase-like protein